MYKRILLAYDGSEGSEIALREAMALAAEFDASLKLITVVPPLQGSWPAQAFAGVSGDSAASHQRFAAKCELPFTLLVDDGKIVADGKSTEVLNSSQLARAFRIEKAGQRWKISEKA